MASVSLFGDVLIGLTAGMLFAAALKHRVSATVLVVGVVIAFCLVILRQNCVSAESCLTAVKDSLDGVVRWILSQSSLALGWAAGLGIGHAAVRPRKVA